MLPQEISWVSEYSDRIPFSSDKALQIGWLFHLSISTWKVFLYIKNIFIIKTLTDFGKTTETEVDPRLCSRESA